jgi:hypothetical protein
MLVIVNNTTPTIALPDLAVFLLLLKHMAISGRLLLVHQKKKKKKKKSKGVTNLDLLGCVQVRSTLTTCHNEENWFEPEGVYGVVTGVVCTM